MTLMPHKSPQRNNPIPLNRLGIFLLLNGFFVLVMICLGGITRLTGSGLSMVVWEPITGALPPLSQEAWEAVFAAYRQTPEFQSVNFHMDLSGFKGIFWLEYIHRLWGRLIGLSVFATFLYSLKSPLTRTYSLKIAGIFLLGGLQGVVGWYMVKSGLSKDPHVSPYRLMIHLVLGTASLFLLIHTGLRAHGPIRQRMDQILLPKAPMAIIFALSTLTLIWGALVAGFKAGLIYNTFPLMGGRWIPEDFWFLTPGWRNFIENPATIQWTHRALALTTLFTTWGFIRSQFEHSCNRETLNVLQALGGLSLLQVFLGVLTLIKQVPVDLGALHQLVGVIFVTTAAVAFAQSIQGRQRTLLQKLEESTTPR